MMISHDPLGVRRTPREFCERTRDLPRYAVRRGGSGRASAVESTKAKAIERAREIAPNAKLHVERVRDTSTGHRDQWRKP